MTRKIGVLLGGSSKSPKAYTKEKVCALCRNSMQGTLMGILLKKSNAQELCRRDFYKNPSAQTATQLAESEGFYYDTHSIDAYPLMIFINNEKEEYMLYSDVGKGFWITEEDGREYIHHSFDTFVEWFPGGRFRYTNLGSSNIFDSGFNVVPLFNTEGVDIGNTFFHESSTKTVTGTPIFH